MLQPRQQLLNSYHDFVNYSGKTVFDHLLETFVLESDPDNEAWLEDIPHPYREYVRKGQRMVVEHMRLCAMAAEEDAPEPIELTKPLTVGDK